MVLFQVIILGSKITKKIWNRGNKLKYRVPSYFHSSLNVNDCPAGLELTAGARNRKNVILKIRRNPPLLFFSRPKSLKIVYKKQIIT